MTTVTARCYNTAATASRFEEQLKEEQALTAKAAYTDVFDPGEKVQIGLLRWYDSNLQRWINRDPPGERFERNLYRFNYNSPLHHVDPDGLVGDGIVGGGVVNIGVGGIGAGGNVAVGAGVFWGGPAGVNTGALASGGAFARESPGVVSLKCPNYNQTPWALGAYAGVGGGGFLTNAKKVADLAGPFKQWNLNTPFGSITFGWSDGTRIVGIVAGPGDVGDVSGYPTTTITYPRR